MACGTASGTTSGATSGADSDSACGALLSCLGFPGWGGLHLIVPSRGDPPGLARRLQLADGETAASAAAPGRGEMPAGLLLPALLRQHRDLEPLDPGRWPWAVEGPEGWPETWGHRYLLVCRWGAAHPLRISAWRRQGEGQSWVRSCEPMPLASFRQRFLGTPDAAGGRRGSPGGLRR